MEWLIAGCIGVAFVLKLAWTGQIRRRHRRDLGLPPEPQSWRDDAPEWSDPRYFRRYGRNR